MIGQSSGQVTVSSDDIGQSSGQVAVSLDDWSEL